MFLARVEWLPVTSRSLFRCSLASSSSFIFFCFSSIIAMPVALVRTHAPLLFIGFDDFGVEGMLGKVRNSVSGERGFLVDPYTDLRDGALLDTCCS